MNSLGMFAFSDRKEQPTAFLTLKFMYKKFLSDVCLLIKKYWNINVL